MRASWRRLDELVEFDRTPLTIEPEGRYSRLGIYSWGKGHFVREPAIGLDMGKMKYFEFPKPSLVFSNIQAWEGAVALVQQVDSTVICSSRFYPYVARADSDVSLKYLYEFFRSTKGQQLMREKSSGTQVRNKLLSRSGIEAALVPVPAREEQDRIADHLGSLSKMGGEKRLDPSAVFDATVGRSYRVREVLQQVTRAKAVEPTETYALRGVKWYGGGLFVRELKAGYELSAKSLRRIHVGDLVYNRLFAWKQSFALAQEDGWASNEFPTFEVNTDVVRPRVLLACLLSESFTEAVNLASTGSTPTSRNRLKEQDFLDLAVTIPPREKQEAVERALLIADRALLLSSRRNMLSAAVLPAARNSVFDSMR